MGLKAKKSQKKLAARQDSYHRTMSKQGFVNRSYPKGLGTGGYTEPGSNKK